MPEAKRILVLAPTAAEADNFRDPAAKLALDLLLGCADASGTLRLDFNTRDSALHTVMFAQEHPLAAIIPIGDETAPVAARASSMLGLPFHPPKSADACRNKPALKTRIEALGLTCASPGDSEPAPLTLVCLMHEGRLRVLAARTQGEVPRALSSYDTNFQRRAVEALKKIVRALGLKHGPVFVRLWAHRDPVVISDVSACYLPAGMPESFSFRIPLVDVHLSFEEVVIRNALGLDTTRVYLEGTG